MKHMIFAAIVLFTTSAFATSSDIQGEVSSPNTHVRALSCLAANGLTFTLKERGPGDNMVTVGFGLVKRPYYITQTSWYDNGSLFIQMSSDPLVRVTPTVSTYMLQLAGKIDEQGNYAATGTADKLVVNMLTGIPLQSPPVGVTCKAVLTHI